MVQSEWHWNRADGSLLPTPVHPQEIESHSPHTPPGCGTPQPLALDQASDQADFQTEINFRHSGWAPTRQRVADAMFRVVASLDRLADFASCGQDAWVERSDQDPHHYRIVSRKCHDRWCLPCGQERSRVIAHNVHDRLNVPLARMVTLTLKTDAEPLQELLDKLYQSFARLRRTKIWESTQAGGVAFLEVKWAVERQRWHPHLHVLSEGKYIAKPALAKAWLKATGNSFIVDVGKIKSAAAAISYVVKYASKPMDASLFKDSARLDEAILAMKGRRLALTYGTWRGVKLTDVPESGTWTPVGSLISFIARAKAGDPIADAIIRYTIWQELTSESRAPPDNGDDI